MPRAKKPSVAQAELLRKQTIGPDGPGTILRDFESLLDFIGPEGLRTTGKYHFLPLSRLLELDAKMAKPLRPGLSRPQQRSFPHLTGLYLLLRTTEFALAKGEGQAGRLVQPGDGRPVANAKLDGEVFQSARSLAAIRLSGDAWRARKRVLFGQLDV